MKLFTIKSGTPCRVVKVGNEWTPGNILTHETEHENVFEVEDIAIDPVGRVNCHAGMTRTIGGSYARNGYYGFVKRGWIIIVHQSFVQVS